MVVPGTFGLPLLTGGRKKRKKRKGAAEDFVRDFLEGGGTKVAKTPQEAADIFDKTRIGKAIGGIRGAGSRGSTQEDFQTVTGTGGGRPTSPIERGGKQFVLPAGDIKTLQARGKLKPGESLEEQEAARVEDQARFERETAFEEIPGTKELKEGLVQKATPGQEPELKSDLSTIEAGGSIILEPLTVLGNFIGKEIVAPILGKEFEEQKSTELIKEDFGKFLAGGIGATTGLLAGAAGFAGLSFMATAAAKSAVLIGVAGAGTAMVTLGGKILGFGSILNLNRGEIDEMKKIARGMTLSGERAQALAINSPKDVPFVVAQLQQMADDLEYAESTIRQKATRNFDYRGSKEYINDQKDFRDARLAILRRLEAVENIAITGAAPGNIDEFILSLSEGFE
jgi:hypothetical protein